jgi:hypothetical protein
VHNAGDRVAAADLEERGQVGDIGLFGEHLVPRLPGQVVR